MKSKGLWWAVCLTSVLVLTAGICTLAQAPTPVYCVGVIHDYSPVPATNGATAWEVRGPWSLRLDQETGTASFTAALTMEFSVSGQNSANVLAVALAQHAHQIKMTNATVTYNPTNCPPAATGTPPYVARIEVNGTASVFANGSTAPFGQFSPLQVCIAGGTSDPKVSFSNITLVFQKPAANHFGPQPIHGVVRSSD